MQCSVSDSWYQDHRARLDIYKHSLKSLLGILLLYELILGKLKLRRWWSLNFKIGLEAALEQYDHIRAQGEPIAFDLAFSYGHSIEHSFGNIPTFHLFLPVYLSLCFFVLEILPWRQDYFICSTFYQLLHRHSLTRIRSLA